MRKILLLCDVWSVVVVGVGVVVVVVVGVAVVLVHVVVVVAVVVNAARGACVVVVGDVVTERVVAVVLLLLWLRELRVLSCEGAVGTDWLKIDFLNNSNEALLIFQVRHL